MKTEEQIREECLQMVKEGIMEMKVVDGEERFSLTEEGLKRLGYEAKSDTTSQRR